MNDTIEKKIYNAPTWNGCPIFEYKNHTHSVIYIEYINKIPLSVYTVFYVQNAKDGPYWRLNEWDFECEQNDKKDLLACNSVSGGCEKDIEAPNFTNNNSLKEVWIADGIQLKGKGKNISFIKNLIELENHFIKSTNPFEVAEIVNNIEYCPKCKCYSRDFCDDHLYYDNDGVVRFRGNHRIVI